MGPYPKVACNHAHREKLKYHPTALLDENTIRTRGQQKFADFM
jgi:hypothetical protein